MKNISPILNAVLLVAVVVLYFLHFTKDGGESQKEETIPVRKSTGEAGELNIAFIDLERLLVDYKLSKELNDSFEERKGEAQNHLEQQVSNYKKEAESYQEKLKRGSFLNQQSAENQQKSLLDKQQQLQMLQMELENNLLEDQQNLNNQLYDSVMNFLNMYNKSLNYKYIFSKMEGGNLLIGDPQMDITGDVVDALNKRYSARQD